MRSSPKRRGRRIASLIAEKKAQRQEQLELLNQLTPDTTEVPVSQPETVILAEPQTFMDYQLAIVQTGRSPKPGLYHPASPG